MKKDEKDFLDSPRSEGISGQPETVFELLNKYGTYNIQPTAESGNDYPKIAQGLAKKEAKGAEKKNIGKK